MILMSTTAQVVNRIGDKIRCAACMLVSCPGFACPGLVDCFAGALQHDGVCHNPALRRGQCDSTPTCGRSVRTWRVQRIFARSVLFPNTRAGDILHKQDSSEIKAGKSQLGERFGRFEYWDVHHQDSQLIAAAGHVSGKQYC